MRHRLEILYNPENEYEVDTVNNMLNAAKVKSVLWDLDQHLRGCVKYGVDEKRVVDECITDCISGEKEPIDEEGQKKLILGYVVACEEIRTKLRELLSENNISLE